MRTIEIQRLINLLENYHRETGDNNALCLICQIKETCIGPKRAGRKPNYSAATQEAILAMYNSGLTMRQISGKTGCSLGYIQKLVKSNQPDKC